MIYIFPFPSILDRSNTIRKFILQSIPTETKKLALVKVFDKLLMILIDIKDISIK
jgi:hypothetical protein